ncbi:cytochrome c oxidase subunit 2 [Trichinella pseudospiralis]|uniref:cytochrome-c oxidase n=1 Tax=Trichinella pseudospiralis TaxID=6337 RepID=A0A0V0XAT3_TRIPS|nr:cytochrome c oxidase subunit 2 [Trichinella pseudospiralis]
MYYQVYVYKGVVCLPNEEAVLELMWTLVPNLGIKMDGVPGRINCLMSMVDRLGVFVGYCTELCGAGHGYMPIVLEVVYNVLYLVWDPWFVFF